MLGGTLNFSSSVQTVSGTTLNTPITFSSSDTSILNIASNGVACAGHWDATFSTCSPGGTGVVQVTATALGSASIPTFVFVHPPIDSITVTGILLDGFLFRNMLAQSESMTLEAHAFSQGVEVTASVGPFTWSESNTSVATLTPLNNSAYNFPTNQATATAAVPGITHIFASASGVTSSSFQQPTYQQTIGGTPQTSPVLDFFATCPVENIALEVGAVGSGQTSFSVTKGSSAASQTAFATITDIMGYSSLPNTNGGIVLSKIPLIWLSSQPSAISVGSGCTETCQLTFAAPGARVSMPRAHLQPATSGFPRSRSRCRPLRKLPPATIFSGAVSSACQLRRGDSGSCLFVSVFVNPPNNPSAIQFRSARTRRSQVLSVEPRAATPRRQHRMCSRPTRILLFRRLLPFDIKELSGKRKPLARLLPIHCCLIWPATR